jgi:mercuric reductase
MGKEHHYPLLIIGGGSAATAAAIEANRRQIPSLLINGGLPIGGTCVNVGCVPSKYLIRAAQAYSYMKNSHFPGIKAGTPELDFVQVIESLKQLTITLRKKKYIHVLEQLPFVTWKEGIATFVDPHTVQVNGERFTADRILIATGSEKVIPPIPGLDTVSYLTNETIFELKALPSHLVIVGAGFIGVELAQAFARPGAQVTLIEARESLLPTLPSHLTKHIHTVLEQEGVTIYVNTHITRVEKGENGIHLICTRHSSEKKRLHASHLLIATGRKAKIGSLKVENAGIRIEKGFIQTDAYLKTSQPHIYAIGDCNSFPPFVYAAAYEGKVAVQNAFACCPEEMEAVDYSTFPVVLFTDPQIAIVGKAVPNATPSYFPLEQLPAAIVRGKREGSIYVYSENEVIQRVEIIGTEGSDLLPLFVFAIQNQIRIPELTRLHYPYLTMGEAIKLALLNVNTDISLLSCCAS